MYIYIYRFLALEDSIQVVGVSSLSFVQCIQVDITENGPPPPLLDIDEHKSLQSLHWEHTHDITVSLPFQLIGQWLLKKLTSPWDIPHTMPQFVWRARAFYLWKSLGWDTSNMRDVWIRYPQYAGKLQGSHACVNKQQYWDALDTISKKHGTLVWSGGPWMYDIYFPTISRLALLSKIRAPFFGKKNHKGWTHGRLIHSVLLIQT